MAWNDLELSDKARMIKLAVNSGITDLKTIQEVYNKFATGGTKKQRRNNNAVVIPTNLEEIAKRQYYIESKFRDNAVSGAGAQGAYQIMPITYKDYVRRTGNTGDLNDYDFNRAVRDYYMDRYLNSTWATKENQGPYNKMAKALAAYNWGTGNLLKYLEDQKASGVDIYKGKDWISGLPTETRNYIKWILDGEDIGKATTNEAFEAAKAVRFPSNEVPTVRIVNNISK